MKFHEFGARNLPPILLAPHPEVRTLQHQGRHQRGAQPGGTASGPRGRC